MSFITSLLFRIFNLWVNIENVFLRKADIHRPTYEIKGSYRNLAGQQIIISKIVDSPRAVFKISATDLVLKHKDILSGFSIEDVVNIVGLATAEKEPMIIMSAKEASYKYYAPLAMLFGAVFMLANIASTKLITLWGVTMTGGAFVYPLAYILGGIIAEVYGYKRARQLIWSGMLCNIFMVFFLQITIAAEPSIYWKNQHEYALILGAVPRIVVASLIAYLVGEFINSYFIAKFKIAYNGQNLISRILSSSVVAITMDTIIFVLIAYVGVIPLSEMVPFIIRVYLFKLFCEFLLIPITMMVINKLKFIEEVDIFDINTNFSPFSLDVSYTSLNNRMTKPLH